MEIKVRSFSNLKIIQIPFRESILDTIRITFKAKQANQQEQIKLRYIGLRPQLFSIEEKKINYKINDKHLEREFLPFSLFKFKYINTEKIQN